MSNHYILSVIQEYADEHLKEPAWRMKKGWFEHTSYNRWAVDEIIKNIRESKMPPILAVENFIRKMDDFSRQNPKTKIIFSAARDMAENILDILTAMK